MAEHECRHKKGEVGVEEGRREEPPQPGGSLGKDIGWPSGLRAPPARTWTMAHPEQQSSE